jgi:hypothetical protein
MNGHRKDNWAVGANMKKVTRGLAELWRGEFGDAPLRVLYLVPHARWRDQKVTVTHPQGISVCVYVCRLVDGTHRVWRTDER